MENAFVSFPSIESLHNVVKAVGDYSRSKVLFRAKIKLHGTNAGIRICDGQITAQSRNNDLSIQKDNAGFARWVAETETYWKQFVRYMDSTDGDFTVFGEWCGQGIMKGTALNQLDRKIFAVFAIVTHDDKMTVDPEEISAFLESFDTPANLYVLPWYSHEYILNFGDREQLQQQSDLINVLINRIEETDPWVEAMFNVKGIGEGLVFYPIRDELETRTSFGKWAWKAKGEKHRVNGSKEATVIAPETLETAVAFVRTFVTDARLEQGLQETGGVADVRNTGEFLKWVNQDILKESKAEFLASGLDWKLVANGINQSAREWYLSRAKSLV